MDDVVMVPVPRQHLAAVYELLGRVMQKEYGEIAAEEWSEAVVWSAEEIGRLKRTIKNPTLQKIMTLIAKSGADGIEYRALKSETEKAIKRTLKMGSFRAQLSWLMKYSRRIKGRGGDAWPLRKVVVRTDGERLFYSMTKRISEEWLKAKE